MKNFKKISALLLLVAALSVGLVIGGFAEDYTGTVEELNAMVANVDTASDGYTALAEIADYIPTVDPSADGYADAVAAANTRVEEKLASLLGQMAADTAELKSLQNELQKAKAICDAMAIVENPLVNGVILEKAQTVAERYLDLVASETVASTARNQIAINNFNAFIKLGLCDTDTDAYTAMMQDAEARFALQDGAKEANRQLMLADGTLEAYNLATMYDTDFGTGAHPFPTVGNLGKSKVSASTGYLTINYEGNSAGTNTYVQGNYNSGFSSKGVVVDFDFTTFGKMVAAGGFHLEGGGHQALGDGDASKLKEKWDSDSMKLYASYFKILTDGTVTVSDNSPDAGKSFFKTEDGKDGPAGVLLQNSITQGEWMHYTVIFNPENFTYSVYCEYEHLGTYSGKVHGFHYDLSAIRFSASTNVGEWSIDNLRVYQGTALRNLGMFERMSLEEKFVYYANYYTNDALADTLGRYTSKKQAESMLSKYLNEDGSFKPFEQGELSDEAYAELCADIQAAIERMSGFDATTFVENLKISNRDLFIGYVNEALAISRDLSSASIENRKKAVAKVEDFIVSSDGMIDENAEYKEVFAKFVECQRNRYADENIILFNGYMSVYSKVSTLNAMRKYYNLAYAIFNDPTYPLSSDDAELPGFEAYAEAYELYANAAAAIVAFEKNENSKKIIACYELVSVYDPETWEENYDVMNPYVVMIRDTIAEGYFNYDYEGVDKVIEAFTPMDERFYELLQQVHIAEISARLDFVYNNDAYIEKSGTLSYITRYLESNDIDRTNPEMAILISNYETALEELSFREADYETVLNQNASYFVSLVEKMRISNDFNEKRELYDKAIGFYFALNANYEGAQEAIAVFDAHTDYFEKGEISSTRFLDAVVILRTADTEEEKYEALVNCYIYSLDAVDTYTGVEEALEYFNAEYEAYSSTANEAIKVIESIGVTVGSVRANCGAYSIIAVIVKKLFD